MVWIGRPLTSGGRFLPRRMIAALDVPWMEVLMRLVRFSPLFVMLVLSGCGLFSSSTGAPLIADMRSPIEDVPVPAGFTMTDTSSSKMVAQGGVRIVNHYYTGDDNILAVASFYRDKLPQKNWLWVDQLQPTGKEVIEHFSKKGETCTVTITRRLFDTMIRIQIDPLKP
jgi:hypothetical protein